MMLKGADAMYIQCDYEKQLATVYSKNILHHTILYTVHTYIVWMVSVFFFTPV